MTRGRKAATGRGRRPRCRLAPLALLAAVIPAAGAGCTQAPAPEAAPAQPVAEDARVLEPLGSEIDTEIGQKYTPEDAELEAEVPSEEENAPAAAPADPTVILIESGERSEPRTLWEAAVAAREQRERSSRPRISIRDDNLHEYQDAEVTFAEPREDAGGGAADEVGEGGAEEAPADVVRGEEYWRSAVLDLRLRLRAAVDELKELEERAAELRRSFYAQDDPYVRDAEIKPAWDRTLDRIGSGRRRILDLYRKLEDTLEAGRRAGALPGWLREGIALEPAADELPQPRDGEHQPREPEIMEIGGEEEEPPPGP